MTFCRFHVVRAISLVVLTLGLGSRCASPQMWDADVNKKVCSGKLDARYYVQKGGTANYWVVLKNTSSAAVTYHLNIRMPGFPRSHSKTLARSATDYVSLGSYAMPSGKGPLFVWEVPPLVDFLSCN